MTKTEEIYGRWLGSDDEAVQSALEGQLVAICITACRMKGLAPPFEKRQGAGRSYWEGGYRALPRWVRTWLSVELGREMPLRDHARYIGRRCTYALIDEIKRHQRRRNGAQQRYRPSAIDKAETERVNSEVLDVLRAAKLHTKLRLQKDKELIIFLIQAYPRKLSNVAIAAQQKVSEGAIRKRRKRVGSICFEIADGDPDLKDALLRLGLRQGTK